MSLRYEDNEGLGTITGALLYQNEGDSYPTLGIHVQLGTRQKSLVYGRTEREPRVHSSVIQIYNEQFIVPAMAMLMAMGIEIQNYDDLPTANELVYGTVEGSPLEYRRPEGNGTQRDESDSLWQCSSCREMHWLSELQPHDETCPRCNGDPKYYEELEQ